MEGKTTNTVCRLCIGQNVPLHHVFEFEVIPGWTVADAIWELLRIQVSESDVYPQFICAECIRKLVDFKLFKHQCEVNKETLDLEYNRSREVDVNEDVVGMIFCGTHKQSELLLKEEDVEVPIENDPLDLSEERNRIKSEIEDPSDYEISSSEVYEPADQVSIPIKCEFEDQLRTVDSNEITLTKGTFRINNFKMRKLQGAHNPKDLLLQKTPIGDDEVDPALNLTSKCKEEMPIHSGTGESVLGEIPSFRGENAVWIMNDSSVTGAHGGGSITDVEDETENVLQIHERVHRVEDASQCDDGTTLISRMGRSSLPKCNPILDEEEVKSRECDKISSQENSRKGQNLRHSIEKPFKCGICCKTYLRSHTLGQHMKTHFASSPFQCKECNKVLSSVYNLKAHMLTHTGERPFKCGKCRRTFTQKAHLEKHWRKRTHRGEIISM